jgi:hypothetical protein
MSHQDGLTNHGAALAGSSEPDNGDNYMQNQDENVSHTSGWYQTESS